LPGAAAIVSWEARSGLSMLAVACPWPMRAFGQDGMECGIMAAWNCELG
jgi:hypothetical protein